MKIKLEQIAVQSRAERELIDITADVERVVADSGIAEGLVNVMTKHTSSGIVVTEGQECLKHDVVDHMNRLAPLQPEAFGYYHNRYLDSEGRLGINAGGAHLQSVLTGYFAMFPITQGHIVRGGRQRVFFAEFDGPLLREVVIQVLGE